MVSQRIIDILRDDGPVILMRKAGGLTKRKFLNLVDPLRYRYHRTRSDGESIVRDVQGSKMRLYFETNGIDEKLIMRGVREPYATRRVKFDYESLCDSYEGEITVFDIGSNIGYYALLASHVFGHRAEVHAFEPEPQNVNRLKKNIGLNSYDIYVHQQAVGDELGEVKIALHTASNRHSVADLERFEDTGTISVPQTTLDQYVDKFDADGLVIGRIDVEGYEWHVLQGMCGVLESDQDCYLFVEIHSSLNTDQVEWIQQTLVENGFDISWVQYGDEDEWPSDVTFHIIARRIQR